MAYSNSKGQFSSTPQKERPRERCLETGPSCLSLRECIALLLGSGPPGSGCMGVASQILTRPGEGLSPLDEERAFFHGMEVCGLSHLTNISGLGPAGQAKILVAIELGRRYSEFRVQSLRKQKKNLPRSITGELPYLAYQALSQIPQHERSAPQEWLGFVPLYRTGRLGGLCIVERGVRTHVNTDPTEIFARLLSLRPKGFFLFHNHPSGIPTPSPQDLDLTERVGLVSRPFEIQLLGHWVVTSENEHLIPPMNQTN